jgi:hypothetical protein
MNPNASLNINFQEFAEKRISQYVTKSLQMRLTEGNLYAKWPHEEKENLKTDRNQASSPRHSLARGSDKTDARVS